MKAFNKIILLIAVLTLTACSSNKNTSTDEMNMQPTAIPTTESVSSAMTTPDPVAEVTEATETESPESESVEDAASAVVIDETDSLNFDQISNGDLSSLAGNYINPDGEVITLNENGLREHEFITIPPYLNQDIYYVGIGFDNSDGGVSLVIYPENVEVKTYDENGQTILDSDVSKVRIYYGQGDPTSVNQIYTKN